MRDVPASIATAWTDGLFIGDRQPIARVTVQHPNMRLRNFSLMSTFSYKCGETHLPEVDGDIPITDATHGQKVAQSYADFFFSGNAAGVHATPKELPNIKSVQWTRSVDTDVADCTIECWNTKPLGIGEVPTDDLDLPGYYTYDRGATVFGKTRWGHVRNEWFGLLVPDNIIRTYEGYGFDATKIPEKDTHLVLTGTWIIDSVTSGSDGTLTIRCRDVGRILLDQMYYAPVVPDAFYDEDWRNWDGHSDDNYKYKVKFKPVAVGSSSSSGAHTLSKAFDGNPNTYWLSKPHTKPSGSYEYVSCSVGNHSITEVRLRTKKKGYTAYVHVMIDGHWQGSATIDGHKYVISQVIDSDAFTEIILPKTYAKVQRVRITLGNLKNFKLPGTAKYRAGIRDVEVYGKFKVGSEDDKCGCGTAHYDHLKVGPAGSNPNRYSDYTDIVKLILGWAGFFCPEKARQRLSDGSYRPSYPVVANTTRKFDTGVLGAGVRGRIWGDFLQTGTTGPAQLELANFDKKSLMDAIGYVRDIVGFIFYIDETGAAVWRQPNIHDYGSQPAGFSRNTKYRKGFAHPIDESTVLLNLSVAIDSKSVREAIFVGDILGKKGAYAPGFNPNPTGLRRITGWTDQNFTTVQECEVMADLISLRQLFNYRTDRLTIPANPAIQIDDQVRISERVTAEGYVHYVRSISSNLDMTTGSWTYDLATNWLGYDSPDRKWLFHPKQLAESTQKYLDKLLASAKLGLEHDRSTATGEFGT